MTIKFTFFTDSKDASKLNEHLISMGLSQENHKIPEGDYLMNKISLESKYAPEFLEKLKSMGIANGDLRLPGPGQKQELKVNSLKDVKTNEERLVSLAKEFNPDFKIN